MTDAEMTTKLESLKGAVEYGLANGKTNMVVQLDQLNALFGRYVESLDAIAACHNYWITLAKAWHANEGRVTKTDGGAVVMASADIEELCRVASEKVMAIVNRYSAPTEAS